MCMGANDQAELQARFSREASAEGPEYRSPDGARDRYQHAAAALAQEMYNSIAAHDGADLDHSALVQALERLANHQVAK